MIGKLRVVSFALVPMLFTVVAASAQSRLSSQKCSGPIYDAKDVTRRARIIEEPNFNVIHEAFGRDVHAHVNLEAVLCRSGHVTDIRVIESTPPKVAEFVVAAVSLIRFTPAELRWHTVSQRMQFEFSINDDGIKGMSPPDAANRLIEELDVVGNRKVRRDEILAWVHTRPGDFYNSEQINGDLNAILATGYFDKAKSRVLIQDAARGGVVITFEVVELPLIEEVKFEGLAEVESSVILEALRARHVDLSKGARYDVGRMRIAIQIIKEMLASRGLPNAKVELRIQRFTATTVSLTFVISSE